MSSALLAVLSFGWLCLPHVLATIEKKDKPFTFPSYMRSEVREFHAGTPKRIDGSLVKSNKRDHLPDNSEPRSPQEGDIELTSNIADILPGAGPGHLHGLVGRDNDGIPIYHTIEYPTNASEEILQQSYRGYCFDSRMSRSIPLDRYHSDYRSKQCIEAAEHYKVDSFQPASIIFVFHNEDISVLLRSVHSVLNESPPNLLKEIILVDDSSQADPERFSNEDYEQLQVLLPDYVKHLPKIRLVRLKQRRGLMLARMEGAWRAQGDVLIFLDSHIEATKGWIEPLLARIHEDPRHVVVPAIDGISAEDFTYMKGAGLGVLGFTWTLGQEPRDAPTDDPKPVPSPIMAGGLFAANREYFMYLGGYDQGMELYGGEEMEIGFRTWMCGGSIELIPCSHVGHVFRSDLHWHGQAYRVDGETIAKNKLRAAEVWMDHYKDLVKLSTMRVPDIGTLDTRLQLREKLHCKDFEWYLKNIDPKMYVPKYSPAMKKGALENKKLNACVDNFGGTHVGDEFGAYPCHGLRGTQAVLMDEDGRIMHAKTSFLACMWISADGSCTFRKCEGGETQFLLNATSGTLRQLSSGKCLTVRSEAVARSPFKLGLDACKDGDDEQKWEFIY